MIFAMSIFYMHHTRVLSALAFLGFSLIVNVYLKEIWAIPLNSHLNSKSFAFPSGHTQFFSIAMMMLFIHIQNIQYKTYIALIFIALIPNIIITYEFYKFHTDFEIYGAIGFAFILSTAYYLIYSAFGRNKNFVPIFSFLFSIISFLLIKYKFQKDLKYDEWIYITVGFIFSIGVSAIASQRLEKILDIFPNKFMQFKYTNCARYCALIIFAFGILYAPLFLKKITMYFFPSSSVSYDAIHILLNLTLSIFFYTPMILLLLALKSWSLTANKHI